MSACYFSFRVEEVARLGDAAKLFAFKDTAWRSIFWVSLPPGILFVIGSLMVSESPRWLFRRGKSDAAYAALLRSRTDEQAEVELGKWKQTAAAEKAKTSSGTQVSESLLRRKYVIPFVLACVILACNQATGINSIIGYNTNILLQSGLSDVQAHWGYVLFTIVNFLMTIGGVLLVDRKGRKFLLSLGSAGIIVSLLCTGLLFRRTEKLRVDSRDAVQSMVDADQKLTLLYDETTAGALLAAQRRRRRKRSATGPHLWSSSIRTEISAPPPKLRVPTTRPRSRSRSRAKAACPPIKWWRSSRIRSAISMRRATAPLKIDNALITPVPTAHNGWLVAISLFVFMAFFAIGPGVCVWLALSELMPTRIRSNGMSIALLINQAVSTTIAAIFLPTVGKYGYSTMFFGFAACTVIYFITAAVFLPETKGKTLEEIEAHFEGAGEPAPSTA